MTVSMDGEHEADYYAEGDDEEEEYEVEEVADDTPMRIHARAFLGSIDAARNRAALAHANVGITFALLGAGDERVVANGNGEEVDGSVSLKRVLVKMEDSMDEPLFQRLPALLATLQETLSDAEKRDCNVLFHCMAGRSRSPSLVAAWLMTTHQFTLQQALEHIEMIRPWIEINARFMKDLQLFGHVVRYDPQSESSDSEWKSQLTPLRTVLPRLDFGASLVSDILAHEKTVTMRLPSDVENDHNSDLQKMFQHATVVATTAAHHEETSRKAFAYLRIDHMDTEVTLAAIDQATVTKTGYTTKDQVLSVLQTFYPEITMDSPLIVLSFTCIGGCDNY